MYVLLRKKLKEQFTEPPNSPDLHAFRLIDMYTRASLAEMNEEVMSSFKTAGSKLRIVIATVAFSMGVDCPDIRQVIHYGVPNLIEEYVQETGQAGRDGLLSEAELILKKRKICWEGNNIIWTEYNNLQKKNIISKFFVLQGSYN